MDSIEVSYNPATNRSTYRARSHTAAIHNIQKRQKSQALTIVGILQEDAEGKITGLAIETKCKIDTGTAPKCYVNLCFQEIVPSNV